MPQKISVIRCPKCGYEPNVLTDICLKCRSKLEKLCGTCGFSNAVEKNYCDKCGALLALKPAPPRAPETAKSAEAAKPFFPQPPKDSAPQQSETPAKPRLEMQPIQDTMNDRAASFHSKTAELAAKGPLPSAQYPKTTPAGIKPRLSFKKYEPALFGLTVVVAALLAAYLLAEPLLPGFLLKRAAANYLDKLSTGRYREAYDLLSTNSKSVCSLEDYIKHSADYYSKFPRWQFKDITIFSMGKNGAMIKYRLKEGNNPWQDDYISFISENGKWTRPYIWTLFEPIDSALEHQDYPQALFLAQKLYITDPIDPRTAGYLCTSEFFMGLYNESAESCRSALKGSETYPVGFSPEEVFWYRFYYAESLRCLEKYEPAIKEYDDLLDDNRLSVKEQCPLYVGRADALVRIKNYDKALDDAMKADSVCSGEINKKETEARLRFLNGDAKQEAISFVQRSRSAPDQPPLLAARERDLEDLAAKSGYKKTKFAPRDVWIAAHITGPEYRVILRQETTKPGVRTPEISDIMVFTVNLWTSRAKLERGSLPAPRPQRPGPP